MLRRKSHVMTAGIELVGLSFIVSVPLFERQSQYLDV